MPFPIPVFLMPQAMPARRGLPYHASLTARSVFLRPTEAVSICPLLTASVGLKKTLLAVKDAWYGNPRRAGIACGIKNTGIGNGMKEWGRARLAVENDGTVTIYNGFTEMGQGLLTVLIQCACEVTGLRAFVFRARVDPRAEDERPKARHLARALDEDREEALAHLREAVVDRDGAVVLHGEPRPSPLLHAVSDSGVLDAAGD